MTISAEGSQLMREVRRALIDGVPDLEDPLALLGQLLACVKVSAILDTCGDPWPDVSVMLGGERLREVLRLYAGCLTRLREASEARSDDDGAAYYGALERRVLVARAELLAAAIRRADAAS